MAVSGVNQTGTNTATSNDKNQKSTSPGGELGKDEFLQLLVTQLQYQDPLDPQDNSEYIAQLAQFTSVEQMSNLNTTLNALGNVVADMNTSVLVGQLGGMIGQDVRWTTEETVDGKVTTKVHTGKVTAVKVVDGVPSIVADEYGTDGKLTGKVSNVAASQINGIGNLADLTKDVVNGSTDKKDTATSDTTK